jgi:transposase-like protein
MSDSLDLCKLIEQFGSEEKCRRYLEMLRWDDTVLCPRCMSDKISRIYQRDQFDCDACRYQFSVTAGTMFADSHLPLWKWFLATYLICESKKGMSANQIKRVIGVSYKTAWYLCHRIRAAMKEVDVPKLGGICEVDETYVGGKRKGAGERGRGVKKEVVIGIRQRGGDLRMVKVPNAQSNTLYKVIHDNIDSEDVEFVMTDDFVAYQYAMGPILKDKHLTINHSSGQYVSGDIYTNTVESAFSLLKRGIIGTWHKVSAKHLPAYLDEMCWRFNNRKNQFLFRDTLLKMLEAEHVEYKKLTSAA